MKNQEMLEFIKSRRSTRKYTDKPLTKEQICMIVEAGRFAPSGGNSQTTHFLVITNKEILTELAEMVKEEFSKMEVQPDMYRSIVSSITASKTGKYVFHYNTPVLIVTANQKDYGNNLADCSCALENMMIQANAMDLGSCWINQLKWLNENPILLTYMRNLGLKENERVYGALAIGYPDTADGMPARNPLPRNGNLVTYID